MATLRVHVVPNAKIDKVAGEHGAAIKIKLRRAGSGRKSKHSADQFSGRAIERARANDCFAARSQITRQTGSLRRTQRRRTTTWIVMTVRRRALLRER